MAIADEVREFLKDFGFVRRRIFFATECTEPQEQMIRIEPEHPERDDLMKGRRREAVYRRIPYHFGIWNGFDVEDQERSRHIPEASPKGPRIHAGLRP